MSPHFTVQNVEKFTVVEFKTASLMDQIVLEEIGAELYRLVDSQEHGVMRVIAEDPSKTREVLKKLNLPMTETEVICIDLPNRPGALADVATLLGQNHININYAYVTSGAPGGRTTGVFKVADQAKALHVLKKSGGKHKEPDLHRGQRR